MYKKLAATLMGAIMAFMPLAGSALADYTLGDFPAPFVEDSTPSFLIIVGSGGTAAGIASDLSGLINVAARLGGETVTTEGDVTTSVSGGVQVAAPGSDLNYGEAIKDIILTGFSNTAFPDMLKKGTYEESEGDEKNDETYTQTLDFTAGHDIVLDTNDNEDEKPVGTYMWIKDGTQFYQYELEFTNPINVDNAADMENTEIEILGKTYTISDVTHDGDAVTAIELLGGASEQTVSDEETVTVTLDGTEYEITPDIYDTDSVTFTVEYDGTVETTNEMDEGDTEGLDDGTELGVRDILYSSKETKTSAVTFYLGAQKVTLTDSSSVKINDEDIDDYDTDVTITSSGDEVTKIAYTLTPEDDTWLGIGDEWLDPVFGAWKVMFTGLTKMTEEFTATASGDDGTLTVTDVGGNEVEIPFIVDASNDECVPGDELASGYTITANGSSGTTGGNLMLKSGDACTGDSAITACEGTKFLAVNIGGEARIIEIDDIDTSGTGGEIDFKDLTTGETWDDKSYTNEDGSASDTISLGSFMEIDITINESAYEIVLTDINDFTGDAAPNSLFATSLLGEIGIEFDDDDAVVNVFEDDGNEIFDFTFNDVSDDMEIETSDADEKEDEDSDIKWGLDSTNWGALMVWDSDDKDDLTIEYPAEQVIAVAFVAPETAVTSTSGDVGRTGVIKSNIAVVDTDVTSTQKSNYHMILGGGPAVNKLAAEALGLDFPTYGADSGIPEDGYMIKLVEDAFVEGKYALVIAGWEAEQTTEAMSKVQANMAEITGTEYYYPEAPEEEEEADDDTGDDTGDDDTE